MGIFAQRRWTGMAARGHDVRVVVPTPRAPWPLPLLSPERFGLHAGRPREEVRAGLAVAAPRYWHISGRARANAQRFADCGVAKLTSASDWQPDAVVCDYAWPASAAAPALRAKGIACVISGRGSDVLEVAGEANLGAELRANLRAAGAWCAVSEDLVKAMDTLAGEERGVLVPNGVDSRLFDVSRRSQRHELRAQLGWSETDQVVLVVGHLIQRKDPVLALQAFASLSLEHPDARLLFVGSGALESELQAEVTRRRLEGSVSLVGEREPEQLAELYAAADLLLLTSSREGRPNVVLEALSSGLPVVATAAGGTAELLEPGPLEAIDSRYPSDLARAMESLLNEPPAPEELAASVAALSWDAGLARLESLLEEAPR